MGRRSFSRKFKLEAVMVRPIPILRNLGLNPPPDFMARTMRAEGCRRVP